ncbi:sulfatase family protein [Novipirellula artificiosorum]|uniref:Arylsulfatase n=1 Tax=Novipirellula artificiosorum TaxID=2528016 RepID=A0A5C6D7U6_9BACT|nr:arylsulfatase [Novipirellula artificiosorum]TWU31787.1 Arylsulfatase [Novipirellula artificiosorum]
MFRFVVVLSVLFLQDGLTASLGEDSNQRPNIIVIMADDLGYGDVGCYGGTAVPTPSIDRLAAEGMRFTSGYCSASTCTPTRYSFLTGTYAFRVPGTGVAPPNAAALIPAGTTTIASQLNEAGYATAVIGKWHLGLGEKGKGPDWNGTIKPGPLELGFDHCLLLPTTNDRVPQVYVADHHVENLDPEDPLWVGNKKPFPEYQSGVELRDSLRFDSMHGHRDTVYNGIGRIGFYTGGTAARFLDEDLADRWVEHSKAWLTQHKNEPFFLFFSSHDIHAPRVTHPRFENAGTTGPRGDMIAELDWCVGQLIDHVEELGLTKQTLFVFCSDNGPVLCDDYLDGSVEHLGSHDPNGPYRGGKYNVFEAGTRTPLITRMPDVIPVGVSDEMVCTIDLAASFSNLVGQPIPKDACLDSLDQIDVLLGHSGAVGREFLVEQDNGGSGNFGLRVGHWKLVRCKTSRMLNTGLRMSWNASPPLALYDLSNDPGETSNVIDTHPEIGQQLDQRLQQIIDEGRTRSTPSL